VTEDNVYARIGEEGFARLIRAFYAQVPADDILGSMYPADDLAGAEERLRDFVIGRFGGPPRYIEQRGHPRLRMRHMPFRVGATERDRWLHHMLSAVEDVTADLADGDCDDVRDALVGYFVPSADHLRNDGLRQFSGG
jgi:hemoglobin